jgi:hypothetical protein
VSRVAHFTVVGIFDKASAQRAHVYIDRDTNLLKVRCHGRRVSWELPLAKVAESVMWACLRAQMKEQKKTGRASRIRIKRGLKF